MWPEYSGWEGRRAGILFGKEVAGGEEVAGMCRSGWYVRRWLVWVAALPALPLLSFFCFSFPMRDGVHLSPAVLLEQMRGYLNLKKKKDTFNNQPHN